MTGNVRIVCANSSAFPASLFATIYAIWKKLCIAIPLAGAGPMLNQQFVFDRLLRQPDLCIMLCCATLALLNLSAVPWLSLPDCHHLVITCNT
ncbi:hypothetical protein [Sodalis-like endosymbiont of Proechinophthirus fluctus]|uniref:hypothetical protein n=1 Tax=Sodalis-like endosymbiont of Proechinophthirus fluctus TaxID=1462730 RepID=UPI000A6402E4|nr:hypothetical protein [Sodalis-like endosymbiont of Proechinophthirus fluctus]